jgi:hypothetical protein
MSRLSLTAVVAVALLVACESGFAPGDSSVERGTIASQPVSVAVPNPSFQPFAFSVDNCVETVDLTGTFHEVVQFFVGPGGREHFRFHINAKGTGVGRLTGARYQWNDRLFDISNIAPAETGTFTLNDKARLIGQGSAVNTEIATRIKITVNAQGGVTVDRFVARARCG